MHNSGDSGDTTVRPEAAGSSPAPDPMFAVCTVLRRFRTGAHLFAVADARGPRRVVAVNLDELDVVRVEIEQGLDVPLLVAAPEGALGQVGDGGSADGRTPFAVPLPTGRRAVGVGEAPLAASRSSAS
jgi:hypothetical protein